MDIVAEVDRRAGRGQPADAPETPSAVGLPSQDADYSAPIFDQGVWVCSASWSPYGPVTDQLQSVAFC